MLQMPAATLRIWERRYSVAAPSTTASGHRLYSALEVQRLALLRQLTAVGHPIGSLAQLDHDQLKEVAATHAAALAGPPPRPSSRRRSPWRVAVIGPGAARRVERPAVQLRLPRPLSITGEFRNLPDVRKAASSKTAQALIVFVAGLHASTLSQVEAAARALHVRRTGVVYSFASEAVLKAFVTADIALLREPADDAGLAVWLASLAAPGEAVAALPVPAPVPLPLGERAVPSRRYDDLALADFAGLSSTIACECPRHLAEILIKLSHFEAYSAQCERLDAAESALHAYLGQVTGTARALFEDALQRVAVQEGLLAAGA
jgi:DNA-binding transcriptional MerR regulator